jgi:hypothetical protein
MERLDIPLDFLHSFDDFFLKNALSLLNLLQRCDSVQQIMLISQSSGGLVVLLWAEVLLSIKKIFGVAKRCLIGNIIHLIQRQIWMVVEISHFFVEGTL